MQTSKSSNNLALTYDYVTLNEESFNLYDKPIKQMCVNNEQNISCSETSKMTLTLKSMLSIHSLVATTVPSLVTTAICPLFLKGAIKKVGGLSK